jgi:hypothetical protein
MVTTRKNQMVGLMEIAWGYCYRDIYTVIHYYIGVLLAMITFFLFTMAHFVDAQQFVDKVEPVSTLAGAMWYSVTWGFVNTFCFLTLLAILVCLLEYTGNFLIAAYHYDNESWFTVNTIRGSIRSYWKWVRGNQEKQDIEYKYYRDELHVKLISLKTEIE